MCESDAGLVRLILQNPEKGFRSLVSQYSERIYWHIRRMVSSHHDAEDVTQETFIKVFRSLEKLEKAEALKSWLYRIATNEALRHLERNQFNHLPIEEASGMSGDQYIDYSDIAAVELKKAIKRLPPRQQAIFNMRYYDELSYDEIAETLGTSSGAARANYHLAKESVSNYLKSLKSLL